MPSSVRSPPRLPLARSFRFRRRPRNLRFVKPTEIFAAYQVICLANPGDLDAQIAAAKAAPYNFTLAGNFGRWLAAV